MLETVLPYTARQFARAIIMPNLSTPVTTPSLAAEYRRRILKALPDEEAAAGEATDDRGEKQRAREAPRLSRIR